MQRGKSATILPSIAASRAAIETRRGRADGSARSGLPQRSQTRMSPRNPSTSAMPSRGPDGPACPDGLAEAGPGSARSARGSVDLADTIQTRALTSPSCRTGTSNSSCHRADRQGSGAHRSAAGGPADIAAGAKLLGEFGLEHAGIDGAILQRCGVVIEFDERGKAPADIDQRARMTSALHRRDRGARRRARASRIRRWPKAASAARSTRSRSTRNGRASARRTHRCRWRRCRRDGWLGARARPSARAAKRAAGTSMPSAASTAREGMA